MARISWIKLKLTILLLNAYVHSQKWQKKYCTFCFGGTIFFCTNWSRKVPISIMNNALKDIIYVIGLSVFSGKFLLLLNWVCSYLVLFSGEENLGQWKNEITQVALAPSPGTDAPAGTLVLAANRTDRPDILRRFRRYRGGWDIANRHYWAVSTMIPVYDALKWLVYYVLHANWINDN